MKIKVAILSLALAASPCLLNAQEGIQRPVRQYTPGCKDDSGGTDAKRTGKDIMLEGIPDVRQAEYYSCGASSFQAILSYYGINSFEIDLRKMLNTSSTHGTYSWDMVRVAKQLGFDAEWKEELTLNDLQSALQQGFPVIIRAQHYTALNGTWENTWTVGHYMVVIGLDSQNVYLEDPYLLGTRLRMTQADFLASWHSYVSEVPIPPDAKKHYHEGVLIRGTPPKVRPAFIGIDEIPPIVPICLFPPEPVIRANGCTNNITISQSDNLTVTVQLDPEEYVGTPADWWVLLCAGSSWYYLNSSFNWTPEGNLLNWHPIYQGDLGNLPATPVSTGSLPRGTYIFYFAVDYPMNGLLNSEHIWVDSVQVNVQ